MCVCSKNVRVVVVSAYMGGTHGSGVLSSAGGVCDMCLAWGVVGWYVLGVSG